MNDARAEAATDQRLARLEAVQSVILDISRRSARCQDLQDFFRAVHAGVGRIMYARNIYIALRDDPGQDTIRYVYDVDEKDSPQSPETQHPLLPEGDSPTAWVIRNGEPLSVTAEKFAAEVAAGHEWGFGANPEHWLGMPLIDSDRRPFGAFVLQSYTPGIRFSDEDIALFESISNHVAHAIEQVLFANRLESAIAERTRDLQREIAERRHAEKLQHALYEISSQANRDIDLQAFYAELHRILGELLYARNFAIMLYDAKHELVQYPYYADEKDAPPPEDYRRPAGHGLSGYVLRTRQPQRIDQARYQALVAADEIHHAIGSVDFNVWIGTPMIYQDRLLGAIVLQSYDPQIGYGEEELGLLTFVADHIAAALSRKQSADALRAAHARLAAGSEALQAKNRELEQTLEYLGVAHNELMRQEKLASLGALVAGIAHEVNTPLGICVTAVSYLPVQTQGVRRRMNEHALSEAELQGHLATAEETLRILTSNVDRASSLIRSFKQVAVDQSSDGVREIRPVEYFEEVLRSLRLQFKGMRHVIAVDGDPSLCVRSVPGVLSQILSNLVINSIVHGFEHLEQGHVRIRVHAEDAMLTIDFQDDGCGMPADALKHLFDPFYTTKRGRGGSGLGANVVYNLVTTKLGGTIAVDSEPGQGLHYRVQIPVQVVAPKAPQAS
jgi:signal transduction histidine kinase